MTPQRCIAPAHEGGDCWRACIASILNLAAADVPNFVHEFEQHGAPDFVDRGREWLKQYGLTIFRTYCSAGWTLDKILEVFSASMNPGVPMIIAGASNRPGSIDNHAVVAMDGKIVHDPSNSGLTGPIDGYWYIELLSVADNWTAAK